MSIMTPPTFPTFFFIAPDCGHDAGSTGFIGSQLDIELADVWWLPRMESQHRTRGGSDFLFRVAAEVYSDIQDCFEGEDIGFCLYECELEPDADLSHIMDVATGGHGNSIEDQRVSIVNKWSFDVPPLSEYVDQKTEADLQKEIAEKQKELKELRAAKKSLVKKTTR